MAYASGIARVEQPNRPAADVCLIAEGCYPHIAGGVSSWIDWLMRTQPGLTFCATSIVTGHENRRPRYEAPANLTGVDWIVLRGDDGVRPAYTRLSSKDLDVSGLETPLTNLVRGGGLAEIRRLVEIIAGPRKKPVLADLMDTREAFEVVRRMYERLMPNASFLQFYWAWRALFGGLFSTLLAPLPEARIYHAISTGYAGVLAARASIETASPVALTEHGIYTNERRIEILMAEWISDTIDKGLSLNDARGDLRDMWIKVFESYSRACYEACSAITTLYGENQQLQVLQGAAQAKTKVIANGIDVAKLSGLPVAGPEDVPTVALIGRVVPIKDVKTFIAAGAGVRQKVANVRVLVLGPTDEDPQYYEECRQVAESLGLQDTVTFTGAVKIAEYLPKIHVVALSSLSEAQPLVLLEAGAAGIPCVATNVGACREILEGTGTDREPGGFITDLVAADQLAEAISRLLMNEPLRRTMGESLRRRVKASYNSDAARLSYAQLYADLVADTTSMKQGTE